MPGIFHLGEKMKKQKKITNINEIESGKVYLSEYREEYGGEKYYCTSICVFKRFLGKTDKAALLEDIRVLEADNEEDYNGEWKATQNLIDEGTHNIFEIGSIEDFPEYFI